MASLVYLATRSNLKLAGDLARAGHRIFDAQTVSEALYVSENDPVDAIVIASHVEDPAVVEAQMRRITIKLGPEATTKELILELSQRFINSQRTVAR